MLSFTDLNPIEALTRTHDRGSFFSGVIKLDKKLPSYDGIGTTLLGKLAIAEDLQHDKCNLRLGEHLLIDAMYRAWSASQQVASYALVVDVMHGEKGDPTSFYTEKGFLTYESRKDRLFLPMVIIEQTLRTTGIIV